MKGLSKLVAIAWLALLFTVPMIFAEDAANPPKALRGAEQDAELVASTPKHARAFRRASVVPPGPSSDDSSDSSGSHSSDSDSKDSDSKDSDSSDSDSKDSDSKESDSSDSDSSDSDSSDSDSSGSSSKH